LTNSISYLIHGNIICDECFPRNPALRKLPLRRRRIAARRKKHQRRRPNLKILMMMMNKMKKVVKDLMMKMRPLNRKKNLPLQRNLRKLLPKNLQKLQPKRLQQQMVIYLFKLISFSYNLNWKFRSNLSSTNFTSIF